MVHFDALSQVIANAFFHTRYEAESFLATWHIHSVPSDVLMIYDRGYPAQVIPWLMVRNYLPLHVKGIDRLIWIAGDFKDMSRRLVVW